MPNDKALGTNETGKYSVMKPHLVYEARKMLLARWAKYSDPKNLDYEWDDVTNRWERHAINAVLDLEAAEQASADIRRRTLEEVIAKLRAEWELRMDKGNQAANDRQQAYEFGRAAACRQWADELESELKAGEDRQ